MADQNAHNTICDHLKLTQARPIDLTEWRVNLADRWDGLTEARLPPLSLLLNTLLHTLRDTSFV